MTTPTPEFPRAHRRKRQTIFWTILLALGGLGLVVALLAAIKITPYASYHNPHYGISIKYPAYWRLVDNPEGGAVAVFLSPRENELDVYSENVNISVQPLWEVMDTKRLNRTILKQLVGTFENRIKILESKPFRLAGREAYWLSYVGTAPEVSDPFRYLHVWTLKDNAAWIITYAALADRYPDYLPLVKHMIRSFRFETRPADSQP